MLGAYAGKLLRVDLTRRTTAVESIPESLFRKFIGGSGLAAYYLNEETGPETDPLGTENRLIISTGPLTGPPAPTSSRWSATARSPLTGIFGEAECGGSFGPKLKEAGYDAIVVAGAADRPVYLSVSDHAVEIRPADYLWGQDTYATDEILKAEALGRAETISIGLAGERLVRFAAIMNDGHEGRAAARCGLGAVMGAKKLKAVVAWGSHKPAIARRPDFARLSKEMTPLVLSRTRGLQQNGTANGVIGFETIGDLPLRNWTQGKWEEGAARISGQRMAETILVGRYHCANCIIGCGRQVTIDRGPSAGKRIAGPEYESMGALGANCLVDDLVAVVQANDACNRYGMDVISAGSVVAFAMECFERGLLAASDTYGLDLRFGNAEAMVELIQAIGERRPGLGRLLGEGAVRAAQAIGGGAEAFSIHSKGLEFPMHDPRAHSSLALGYATSNRGACHLQGFSHVFEARAIPDDLGYDALLDRFSTEGKGAFVARAQDLMCLYDSVRACKFYVFGGVRAPHLLHWLNHATGWEMPMAEFMQAGERIFNLKRLYNVRLGIRRKDDTISPRVLTLPRGEGGAATNLPDLATMLEEYYAHRGWDADGVPTPEKLAALDLARTPA
ncbi:MAG: aldehyde ferredoxin oxidoreductase family protein [Chloroflexi bacterium]|nr:aldehyde ferredoxin oxidoreductase family protein [Chloroflexota bacterium]